MHNKKAIQKELLYAEIMADRTVRQAWREKRKGNQAEADGLFIVGKEFAITARCLRWVLEMGAPHRIDAQ